MTHDGKCTCGAQITEPDAEGVHRLIGAAIVVAWDPLRDVELLLCGDCGELVGESPRSQIITVTV